MSDDPQKLPPKPFADPENVKFYYGKGREWMNKTEHALMGEYLKDVLVENCEAEREFYNALDYFLSSLGSAQEPVGVPAEEIAKLSDKLFELRFIMKMVHAVGLGRYEETIMEAEIRKRWALVAPVTPPTPAASRMTKKP